MKYTKSLVSLALIGSAFALSACGGSNGAATGEAPSAAAVEKQVATETAKPEGPAKSSRGNFVMKAGSKEFATQTDQLNDKVVAKFTVDSITKGKCTEPYAPAPTNGNIIFVKVTAQTMPELAESSFPKFSMSAFDFKFIAKNGTTFNGQLSTFGCLPNGQEFAAGGIGPDQKASGIIVLDVPQPSGTLLVKSDFGTGYEYTF